MLRYSLTLGIQKKIRYTAKEKDQVMYKGNHIRIAVDLSLETLKSSRVWNSVLYSLKKNWQIRLDYTEKFPSWLKEN
jgi:hypothetical protein